MKAPVVNTTGKTTSTLELPKEIFAASINQSLMAQALRVYTFNQHLQGKTTKTRSQIKVSKSKIWRQKGTGRARHGSRNAPIFVGGGIAHGPKGLNKTLKLNTKMRKQAILSALSHHAKSESITLISKLNDLKPKTQVAQQFISKIFGSDFKPTLLILSSPNPSLIKAFNNIQNISLTQASRLNIYEILRHHHLLIMTESLDILKTIFIPGYQPPSKPSSKSPSTASKKPSTESSSTPKSTPKTTSSKTAKSTTKSNS